MKKRSYKYALFPNKREKEALEHTLVLCCILYNVALEHRRTAYKALGKSITYNDQAAELKYIREDNPDYAQVYSQILQDVLKRVDVAFQGFFRRVKQRAEKAGYPRFHSRDRYDSFTYPQSGFAVNGNHVTLSKLCCVKVKIHREIQGRIKTCTIKREGDKWFIIFICDVPRRIKAKKEIKKTVGFDLGLTDFAVLSDGTKIKNPKYLRRNEEKLKELQSRYSKGKSKTIKKQLSRLHRKTANQRKDFHHKTAKMLVDNYDLIAYEDLKVKKMIEDNEYNLQKSINDAGWDGFTQIMEYKAEDAGTTVIAVNPSGTTKRCSVCDTVVPKELHERIHTCPNCGYTAGRDYNAAQNIHKLGISLVKAASAAPTEAVGSS